MSTQRLNAFPQTRQPKSLPALARVESAPVVIETETDLFAIALRAGHARERNCDPRCLRMLGDVGQAFLRQPVQGNVQLFAQMVQIPLGCKTAAHRGMAPPPLLHS